MDIGGHDSRIEPRLHRQHSGERRAARDPVDLSRKRRRRAMGGRSLRAATGRADPSRWIARRSIRTARGFPRGSCDLCAVFGGLRIRSDGWRVDRCSKRAGPGRCAADSRQPSHHQRIVRREEPRACYRHMVRIDGDHNGCGTCDRRLAGGTCFVALGLLYQYSHRRCCDCHIAVARS